MISFQHVSVDYTQGVHALDDVNLNINKQKCIGIIGENGSGKSTLLLSLLNLVEYDGKIELDNENILKNIKQVREKIGLVFQNPDHQLFMSTVYQDIAFGLKNKGYDKQDINEAVFDIARKLNIEELLKRNPAHLSGGQKRVVSLATVLVMQPDIILMDEPSSFLDSKSRRLLIEVMSSLSQQIIFATHDLDMALDICDEIILLNKGKVIKQAPTLEILQDKVLLERYGLELPLRLQAYESNRYSPTSQR